MKALSFVLKLDNNSVQRPDRQSNIKAT